METLHLWPVNHKRQSETVAHKQANQRPQAFSNLILHGFLQKHEQRIEDIFFCLLFAFVCIVWTLYVCMSV